jgi:hypothetical protein
MGIMNHRFIATSLFTCVALLGTGCSNPKQPDYAPPAVSSTVRSVQEKGVNISLDPFVESDRTRKYFGIDVAKDGIGIVYVSVSNSAPDHTFLIQKRDFQLAAPGFSAGQNAATQSLQQNKGGAEATAMAGSVLSGLGGIALIGLASGSVAHATEVQRNFVDKELPDQTLAPGQSMEGFIYFSPLPQNIHWERGAAMKVTLIDVRSHQPLAMTVPLSQ